MDKQNNIASKIIFILFILAFILFFYMVCSKTYLDNIDTCNRIYPLKIIDGYMKTNERFLGGSETKYYLQCSGIRKISREKCNLILRVSEKKYYDLWESKF